ncbi:MAG: hypothetical protein ACFE7R_07915, partial [Candidatus Hodarchaeota archaeon]
YTIAELTVLSPIFWIVAYLAMTIMFSNAPSEMDIRNAAGGLKFILLFDLIWLAIAFFVPQVGWILPGVFELLAVMFALALAFAGVAYGMFILVAALARIKTPLQLIPLAICLIVGYLMATMGIGSPAFQTIVSVATLVGVILPMLAVKSFRAGV